MKGILTLACFCGLYNCSLSQDVYELTCHLPYDKTQSLYKGFMLRAANGSGFIRLTSTSSQNKINSIYDLELGLNKVYDNEKNRYNEQIIYYPLTRDSFLYGKARYIRTLAGEANTTFKHLIIWFKKNKTTGKYEPYTGNIPFRVDDRPDQYNGAEFNLVNTTGQQQSTQQTYPVGDKNQLTSYKKLTQNNFERKYLQQFFTALELVNKNQLSATQIVTARNKHKPVFYLIAVHSEEKLCRKDVTTLSDYCEDLGGFLNIPFKKIVIRENDFNVKKVTQTIQNLTPGSNDIVIFTYSGHGFSYREDEQNKFPQLALWHGDAKNKEFLRANTINLEEIYKMIVAKKARLNIVIGDCCNSYVEMRRQHIIPTKPGVFGPRDKAWNSRAVSDLFLNTRQSYLLAAAQKGELAGSHDWYGGFFTFYFLEAINNKLLDHQSDKPDWNDILKNTGEGALNRSRDYFCKDAVCGQHMISKTGN